MDAAQVKEILTRVPAPLFDNNIVKLRIFNKAEVDGDAVRVTLHIPTHAYPRDNMVEITQAVERELKAAGARTVEVHCEIQTAFTPPPSAKALLPGTKNIIAVAAGKGGVGKSTVAANLALALNRHGAKVGLLDADVFGPSVPLMLGPAETPAQTTEDQKIIPAIHYGIKVISVGFFVDKDEAVVWRGPMVHRLLQQFLQDVLWGELDYLVCDLPPGTGDVQLSLSQLIGVTGAVMVTTPQEVSIIDVVKGISMFQRVEIPVLGIVENMSYYQCPACGHHDEIFSHGGGKRLAHESGIDFMGEIPIDTKIRYGGDTGVPLMVSAPDSPNAKTFMDIASKVAVKVARSVLSKPRVAARLPVLK